MTILEPKATVIEHNVRNSFRIAKSDILHFSLELAKVQQAQREMAKAIQALRTQQLQLNVLNEKVNSLSQNAPAVQVKEIAEIRAALKHLIHKHDAHLNITHELIQLLEKHKLDDAQKLPVIEEPAVVLPEPKVEVRVVQPHKSHKYVASKASNRLHADNCIFAKNISRKNKLVFHSRMPAFRKGFVACKCMA
jgi:hypothetical protein